MSTTTAVRTADFPKVNLLPGEIAEEQKFRSLRAILALSVIAAVAGVGGLWYLANQQVSTAEEGLAQAQSTQTVLQAEAVKYADVPKVYAQVAQANEDLKLAMGKEIRYSFVLNDLSLTIPSDVWLDGVVVTVDIDGTAPVTSTLGNPAVGTLTIQGHAYKHNNVASWLDSLTKSSYYVDPYFSSSAVTDPIDDQDLVLFSSTVAITDDAYSNRYTKGD
jgi:Tfp pilus assembly protein PilN